MEIIKIYITRCEIIKIEYEKIIKIFIILKILEI